MKTHIILSSMVVPLALVASCATPPREPAKAPAMPADPGPAPASATTQKGIEAGDVNRSVDPCNDFFEYANGTWRAQNPIPTGKPQWSRRLAAREANRQ